AGRPGRLYFHVVFTFERQANTGRPLEPGAEFEDLTFPLALRLDWPSYIYARLADGDCQLRIDRARDGARGAPVIVPAKFERPPDLTDWALPDAASGRGGQTATPTRTAWYWLLGRLIPDNLLVKGDTTRAMAPLARVYRPAQPAQGRSAADVKLIVDVG